ncbi:MAG TPA: sigma-70 family RNA polymerase sigma factor [Thermoanaerobaculia bacterium]|nr:sigma-70 family RNA polymerase sigma factor [Thermoanaerobaculia bacterium]
MRTPAGQRDDDLVRRLREGDETAFTAIYRMWQGPVYRFALRMTGRTTVAEDVTQDTFMTLISGAARFDPERGALSSYLYGIARHRVLHRLERESAYVPMAEGDGDEPREAATAGSADDPLADLERRERITRVRTAVLSLPTHYREAVVLCDLHRLTYREAADALGCAVGTVRSRLHRGRELLVAKLGPVAETAPALRGAPSVG